MQKTFLDNTFADERGNIYSNKTGVLKPLKPQKVNNARSKKQYWAIAGKGLIHRLVASAFLGDVTDKVVDHLDGNPSNNVVSNLEIVSQKINNKRAIEMGLSPSGENHSRAQYTDSILSEALKKVKEGASVNATAMELGISQSYLNKVKNGVYRKYLSDKV